MKIGLTAVLLTASLVPAANFSFTGTFTQDDETQLFKFVVGAASNVTFLTLSYAGGVNSAGSVIARGGFDPILSVYDASGIRVGSNDDGGSSVPADITGERFDTFLTLALGPGSYSVAVSQYNNFGPIDLNSGTFSRAGEGNFTASGTCLRFCDVSGDPVNFVRDGRWAFDILNVGAAAQVESVPEPATLGLMGVGLALAAFRRRRSGL